MTTTTKPPKGQMPATEFRLGYGCASLFGLPDKRDRRKILDAAYALGIRHFDVAPMYGLGLAETELAAALGTRTDVAIATKFGIGLRTAGRIAGRAQGPVRRVLRSSEAVKSKVKSSGQGPRSGVVGRLLYTDPDYSVDSARRALHASMRALGVEKIDYFFLHEPIGGLNENFCKVAAYLESQCERGRLGRWGLAGDLWGDDSAMTALAAKASALQYPYSMLGNPVGPPVVEQQRRITFGTLSHTVPRLMKTLAREPDFRAQCSELLDADLGERRTVVKLAVRDALTQNSTGIVLVSSTNVENLEQLCAAAQTPLANEVAVADMIRIKFSEMESVQ